MRSGEQTPNFWPLLGSVELLYEISPFKKAHGLTLKMIQAVKRL